MPRRHPLTGAAGDTMLTSQVFVSHTSDMAQFPADRSFVQAVLDGIGRAGMAAVDMRYFPAGEGAPSDYCRQRVRECEIYIAVIGVRYGSLVPGTELSYTETEFREASAAGKPRLVFLLDESIRLPQGAADPDRDAVRLFRQRLSQAGLVLARFATPDGLELAVLHALTEVARARPSAASALGTRHSLPPDTAAFTGRGAELDRITSAVMDFAPGGGVDAIRAIGGMPGAGKTALAVHAAHTLRERFPDWQLFIDLHGHTPGVEPAKAEDALAMLLAAAGADPRSLPADPEERARMWRDRMAGQRALLVLDNAASSSQVAPLLPGGGDCLVLITSRRYLGDLPAAAVPVQVDVLPAERAAEMFTRLAPRASTEPNGVAEVVMLAGFLPLAISLLARVFTRHSSWTLADLARETRASLLTMKAEHDSIAAAFDVSYQHLEPAERRFFRFLGLHPGTAFDAYATAALAGISLEDAARLLDTLHGEGLLTETGYHRYGMHDLIHWYARDRAAAEPDSDREQAIEHLLDFYQNTAEIAETYLARRTRTPADAAKPPPAMPDLPGRAEALAWVRSERANLIACLDYAAGTRRYSRVVTLTSAMAGLLRDDGPWTDAVACHTKAVQAAQYASNRLGEARALSDLGTALRLTGDYRSAARILAEALNISQDTGDSLVQAYALSELGGVQYLSNDYLEARQTLEKALFLSRHAGDRLGQAYTLTYLGALRHMTGDTHRAMQALKEALRIYREIRNQLGEADALLYLGALQRRIGDFSHAVKSLQKALDISVEIGNQLGAANALLDLGTVYRYTGDHQGAIGLLQEALRLSRTIGDRLGVASALYNLGAAQRETGELSGAAQSFWEALRTYGDLGDRSGEATVLNGIGNLHRISGDPKQARSCHEQAPDLARQVRISWDGGNALLGLGRCAVVTGHTTAAEKNLQQALKVFQQIGAVEASEASAELNDLRHDRT
jgi:tetratricopeptide (TPR) repeat protein